ncbi:MAG TPA: hypothetical protein VL859_06890 [Flavobacterium sp.]|nr:hypothetical protein [Flavobacterium sp.]
MKSNKDRIQDLKNNGYSLNFETVFNLAFENYKKIALYAGLLLLVITFLFGIAAFFVIAFSYGLDNFQELMKPENLKPENFSETFIIAYIISITLFSCLIGPFFAGLLKMAHYAQIDNEFHVSNVFDYYKSPYFKEIFIATFIISTLNMGISSVFESTGIPLLGFIATLSITFLSILAVPLIIFSDLKAVDAINSSFTLVLKKPLTLLGLIVIAYLYCLTGLFFFFIGLFFALPFLYSMNYAIYRTIIGFNE